VLHTCTERVLLATKEPRTVQSRGGYVAEAKMRMSLKEDENSSKFASTTVSTRISSHSSKSIHFFGAEHKLSMYLPAKSRQAPCSLLAHRDIPIGELHLDRGHTGGLGVEREDLCTALEGNAVDAAVGLPTKLLLAFRQSRIVAHGWSKLGLPVGKGGDEREASWRAQGAARGLVLRRLDHKHRVVLLFMLVLPLVLIIVLVLLLLLPGSGVI